MIPIDIDKLKLDTYYLMYRNDQMFSKEMEIIKSVRLEGERKLCLAFNPIPDTGLYMEYGLDSGVLPYSRIVNSSGIDRIYMFEGMRIEFFELDSTDLVYLICT